MSQEALDEMCVLSAIYCEPDEFRLLEESPERGLVYRIHTLMEGNDEKTPLSLMFHISPDYPLSPPDISISSSDLSRKQCQDLRNSLLDRARSLPPEPMVHDLVLWLQENFCDLIKTSSCSVEIRPEIKEQNWTALLHLDHMRSKAKYIKLIEKWTSELCLAGRLFTGKLILILLQGTKENIKEYIHLQKTVKVDVDSSGKRCKEKMMSVLCEIPQSNETIQMSTFEVKDILSVDDLKREFDSVGLAEIYTQFVTSLI